MATPSIGAATFDGMTGDIPGWRNQVVSLERAGVDGYTYLLQGKRSQPFTLRTIKTSADATSAKTLADRYDTLCGTFVNVTEGNGRVYNKVLVLDVSHTVTRLALSTDGNTYLVAASWQLQRAGP
jgi:hypothetical protein